MVTRWWVRWRWGGGDTTSTLPPTTIPPTVASKHSKLTGSGQDGLLAKRELGDTLVPALDDLANTNGALEGRAAVARRVKLGAVGERADV